MRFLLVPNPDIHQDKLREGSHNPCTNYIAIYEIPYPHHLPKNFRLIPQ